MRILVFLIAIAVCGAATAKCTAPTFVLAGTITDWLGHPVSGAVVGASWAERGNAQGPVLVRSDSDGRYALQIKFNTYTKGSFLRGDICKGKLTNINVSALAPGFALEPERVLVDGSFVTANLSLKATAPDGAAP